MLAFLRIQPHRSPVNFFLLPLNWLATTKARSTTTSRFCSSAPLATGSYVKRQKSNSRRTGTLAITAFLTGVFVSTVYAQAVSGADDALQPGRELFAQKHFKEAEDFFDKALASSSDSLEALVCLAQVYNEEGRYAKAIVLCDRALSLG